MKYRRVVVTKHGGPDVLAIVEEEATGPQAGEVRLSVLAAGVSAYDLMFRRSGILPGTPKPPFTPGEDVVGVVEVLGEGVETLQVGDVVAGTTLSLGVGGGYTESVCLPATQLVRVPDGVDPAEAVCVVVNYLTAHAAMHETAHVQAGESALIHGAAGGVGSALVQLGRLAGLQMYGTASSANLACVESLGASPIDYRNEDFVARIQEATDGGVDVVFDMIGGGRQLRRSARALRPGGRVVFLGVAASKRRGLRVIPSSLLSVGLLKLWPGRQILSMEMPQDDAWLQATLSELLGLFAEGRLAPLVDERVPLAEAARAHARLEAGGHAGKVVLVTDAYLRARPRVDDAGPPASAATGA